MKIIVLGEAVPLERYDELRQLYGGQVWMSHQNLRIYNFIQLLAKIPGVEVYSLTKHFAVEPNSTLPKYTSSSSELPKFHTVTARIDGRSGLKRMFQKIYGYTRAIWRIVPNRRESFFLIEAGPQIPFLLTIGLIKLTRRPICIPYIFDIPNPVSSRLGRILTRIHTRAWRRASKLIIDLVYEGFARDLFSSPYQIIGAAVLPELITQYRRAPLVSSVHNPPTIAYTGTLSDIYDVENLIQIINATSSRYQWVIAGTDDSLGSFQAMLSNQSPDALPVQYFSYVDRNQLVKIQTRVDVLISLRNLNPQYDILNRWADSGKLYEYLLARRPILCTDYPAITSETRQYLHLVPDNSPATLTAALDDLITHPPTAEQLEKGAQYIEKLNDPATNVELLTKFLDL